MADAIRDDRAAAIAAQATAFSQTAEDIVLRTREFAEESLLKGSVDLDVAARLQEKYEQLALDTTYIEIQIEDVQSSLPRGRSGATPLRYWPRFTRFRGTSVPSVGCSRSSIGRVKSSRADMILAARMELTISPSLEDLSQRASARSRTCR